MKIIVFVAFLLFTITACQKADLTLLSEIEGYYVAENLYFRDGLMPDQEVWKLKIDSKGKFKFETPGSTGGINSKITNLEEVVPAFPTNGFDRYKISLRNRKEFELLIKADTIRLSGDFNHSIFLTSNVSKSGVYGLRQN